ATAASSKADLYEVSKLETGAWRLVIAGNDEKTVSRQHARIAAVPDGRIELTNLSAVANFTAGGGLGESQVVMPGQHCQVELPVSCEIGAIRQHGLGAQVQVRAPGRYRERRQPGPRRGQVLQGPPPLDQGDPQSARSRIPPASPRSGPRAKHR